MRSIRLLDRRAAFSLASIGLLLSMAAPAVIPAFASADTLTSRSITLSSSATSATANYDVLFTAPASISGSGATDGGVVIGICSDTPLIGDACTAPAGFTFTGATLTAVEYDGTPAAANGSISVVDYSGTSATNGLKWTANDDFTGGDTLRLTISGVTNPSSTGALYARITTYTDNTNLGTWTDDDTLGTYADDGSVAMNITSGVGVTAYVLETMTFCVSGANPGPDCGASGQAVTSPSLTLGETIASGGKALDATHLSTGTVYAQLSTNASSGAVVNLKSNAFACGGLFRNGDTGNCDIAPMATPSNGSTGFAAGAANFGLTVGSSGDAAGATSPSGTLQATNGYDGTHYFIDYDAGDTTGVTSSYGSAVINSNSLPVNNKYVPVTFGASVSNTTPAGVYGATLNMIAVGTF